MFKTIDDLMFINDGNNPYRTGLLYGRGGLGYIPTPYNMIGGTTGNPKTGYKSYTNEELENMDKDELINIYNEDQDFLDGYDELSIQEKELNRDNLIIHNEEKLRILKLLKDNYPEDFEEEQSEEEEEEEEEDEYDLLEQLNDIFNDDTIPDTEKIEKIENYTDTDFKDVNKEAKKYIKSLKTHINIENEELENNNLLGEDYVDDEVLKNNIDEYELLYKDFDITKATEKEILDYKQLVLDIATDSYKLGEIKTFEKFKKLFNDSLDFMNYKFEIDLTNADWFNIFSKSEELNKLRDEFRNELKYEFDADVGAFGSRFEKVIEKIFNTFLNDKVENNNRHTFYTKQVGNVGKNKAEELPYDLSNKNNDFELKCYIDNKTIQQMDNIKKQTGVDGVFIQLSKFNSTRFTPFFKDIGGEMKLFNIYDNWYNSNSQDAKYSNKYVNKDFNKDVYMIYYLPDGVYKLKLNNDDIFPFKKTIIYENFQGIPKKNKVVEKDVYRFNIDDIKKNFSVVIDGHGKECIWIPKIYLQEIHKNNL